ncbi:hypothetical protein V1511DRAFT_45951 [Dipodascopsis uninucleata]
MVPEYTISQPYLTPSCVLGEGPAYSSETNEWHLVDITEGLIHTYSGPAGEEKTVTVSADNDSSAPQITVFETTDLLKRTTNVGEAIGVLGLTPLPSKLVVGAQHGFASVDLASSGTENKPLNYIAKVYEDDEAMYNKMRFNDGFVDPAGRFLAGSMIYDENSDDKDRFIGTLFSLSADGTECKPLLGKIACPNGLCWTPDNKFMIHSESASQTITKYSYDLTTGEISNPQVLFKIDVPNNYPDGLCISRQGDIFLAIWEGARIEQRDSKTGDIKAIYKFPAGRVTCPAFGGKNFDEIFVTTAAYPGIENDLGGQIFKFKVPGQTGIPRNIYTGKL